MVKIIGLLGFAGSGKDTVADYLVETNNFSKISFAKSLKDVLSSLFGWDRDLIEGSTSESRQWREQPDLWWEKNLNWPNHHLNKTNSRFTPRVAMQVVGTGLFRSEFQDDIWILRLKKELESFDNQNLLITDCRFPNEISMIKDMTGTIIRVKREDPHWVNVAIDALDPISSTQETSKEYMHNLGIHDSEWVWLNHNPDFIIHNNDTIEHLHNQIDQITKEL